MRKRLALTLILLLGVAWTAEAGEIGQVGSMTDRMMMLVLQLGVILLAARLGGALFERLRLPGVLGELASGMLIGPYALGRLRIPGFPEGLFPRGGELIPVSAELYGICAVAAVVLLFSVGLETDLRLLLRYSMAGMMVGLGGVAASFILGAGLTAWLSPWVFGERLGFMAPACLFLGVISTATSVGITARILAERKRLDSAEGVTILAGAVIDDVLGIITLTLVLAITGASRTGGAIDWGHIGVVASKAVGIWLGATAAGLLAAWRIGRLLKVFGDPGAIAMLALGMALILAGFFEEAGLAMIIGAYVMGLSLSRTDLAHVVREKLVPIHEFMVPVFFCVMGMLVDFSAFTSRQMVLFGLIYSGVAILAKVVGCAGPALCFNFNPLGALRVGVGMVPRGEVALIVAGVGLASGLLPGDVFSVAIMMTALTTIVAPPALSALLALRREGVRRPEKADEEEALRYEFPSVEAAELLAEKVVEFFKAEKFFVHLLDHKQRLYQARKDKLVIGWRRSGAVIEFDVAASQVPLVRTAVLEVVAELQRMIRALQAPIDKASIARSFDCASSAPTALRLVDYLSPELIETDLKGEEKVEIIDQLIGLLARRGYLKDVEEARRTVLEREQSMSTGLTRGIAIPHGRTDSVDRLVCAMGIHRKGVDFGALDGRPSRIFFLTLSPRSQPGPHVQFMAAVSQIMTEEVCRRVLNCRTPTELYVVLSTANGAARQKTS